MSRTIFLLVFSLLTLFSSGCGYKGDLIIPGSDAEQSEQNAG
jgi:predicted small lipoprotein YifL